MNVHGWGRFKSVDADIYLPQSDSDCIQFVEQNAPLTPRGLGRSYGDSATGRTIIQSTYLNHYLEFNEVTGVLNCEAGVTINEILQLIVPKGWFLPVMPGTSYVTVGGAIASDIHGKNHHLNGTFSDHLLSFTLMLGTGEIVSVSKVNCPDLFLATCGGMGLTGFILAATIQLKSVQSSQIIQRTIRANCLEEVCELFEENKLSTYSVAWVDCLAKGKRLGRSLLMVGEHAQDGVMHISKSTQINIPIDMPGMLLNKYSIKTFNALYYYKSFLRGEESRLPFESFFFPLDALGNWNRLYGKKGFIQYQFVLPKSAGVAGLKKVLSSIVDSGKGSFLAVLKIFGKSNKNFLSFPMEGYTLALDFKVSSDAINLIYRLDSIIANMGGRIYLTKDALLSENIFKKMYPQWKELEKARVEYGAVGKFISNQSKRLGLL